LNNEKLHDLHCSQYFSGEQMKMEVLSALFAEIKYAAVNFVGEKTKPLLRRLEDGVVYM
jgi:hypothetical protein